MHPSIQKLNKSLLIISRWWTGWRDESFFQKSIVRVPIWKSNESKCSQFANLPNTQGSVFFHSLDRFVDQRKIVRNNGETVKRLKSDRKYRRSIQVAVICSILEATAFFFLCFSLTIFPRCSTNISVSQNLHNFRSIAFIHFLQIADLIWNKFRFMANSPWF